MNYIKKLQADNKRLITNVDSADELIREFIVFLHSSKFNGVDIDGARKDWIATSDVERYLNQIQERLYNLNQ